MRKFGNKKVALAVLAAAFVAATPQIGLNASEAPSQVPVQTAPGQDASQQSQSSIEMEWQRLHDTWQNLPKRQKDQLYKAREAVDKADCNFIDKAVECGLLDKQIGERMKEHIKARTARIREDGDIPMFRRGLRAKPQT